MFFRLAVFDVIVVNFYMSAKFAISTFNVKNKSAKKILNNSDPKIDPSDTSCLRVHFTIRVVYPHSFFSI